MQITHALSTLAPLGPAEVGVREEGELPNLISLLFLGIELGVRGFVHAHQQKLRCLQSWEAAERQWNLNIGRRCLKQQFGA